MDFSCFVAASEAIRLYKSGWMVVDLRTIAAFERFRIPGSIQLAPHALVKSSYLKTRKILLVDEGFNYFNLSSLCSELKKSGFRSVKVLFGGLSQWQRSGGVFDGNVPRYQMLSSISPDSFYKVRKAGCLSIIYVTEDGADAPVLLPESAIALKWKEVSREIGQKAKANKNVVGKQVFVLIDRDGTSYERHMGAVLKGISPVFLVDGGMKALKDYTVKQKLMGFRLSHPQERRALCGH